MTDGIETLKYPYTLPPLGFAYDALEPYFDTQTMEIHHTKHHTTYINKLNATLEKYPDLHSVPLVELLNNTNFIAEDIRQTVINHGGGHANHTLFWQNIGPFNSATSVPTGALFDALTNTFGSFDEFKKQFTEKATNLFGSGWVWLALDDLGLNLHIGVTPNQNSPYLEKHRPLLGLDVWEHAYYLKYQNRRTEYIEAFFNLIRWDTVGSSFDRQFLP